MANELVLSSQIGAAFLQELVADGSDAQEVKERLKAFSECRPDPGASSPRTMRTAFLETMDKPAVIARLHELRDTLPPSSMDTRGSKRTSMTTAAAEGGAFYDIGFLTGDSVIASGNMTNSRDMRFESINSWDGGENIFTYANYKEPNNTLTIGATGMYLIHGELTYTMVRAWNPAEPPPSTLQTSPTFLAPDSVLCPYKVFLTVNAEETLNFSGPPVASPEIINRGSPYFSQELLSGNFTRNEVTKGTKKTRGFSVYMKLSQGDMLSVQFQRGQTMATYGENMGQDVQDGIFLFKMATAEQFDTSNWIELVHMA